VTANEPRGGLLTTDHSDRFVDGGPEATGHGIAGFE
jgi:hypothetical protein